MLEYPQGGLETCVEFECCHRRVAGTSTSLGGVGYERTNEHKAQQGTENRLRLTADSIVPLS